MIQLFDQVELLECDEVLWAMRVGAVIHKDGKPIERDIVVYRARFNVQPTSGKDLVLVPESDRFRESYSLWQPAHPDAPPIGLDCKILRAGRVYQVQHAELWDGSYVQAVAVRIDVSGEAEALAQFAAHVC